MMGQRGAVSGERGRIGRRDARPGAVTRRALLSLLAAACSLLPAAPAAQAQDVVEVLRRQRRDARVAEILATMPAQVASRPLRPLGPSDPIVEAVLRGRARAYARLDSLARIARADSLAALPATPVTYRWAKTAPDEQGAFLALYRETFWRSSDPAASNPIDTTSTTALRGRLQAVFGDPTRNADALRQVGYAGSETVQFEYWFVVNDSIPVLVMDIDGPFGRGLLLAGDEADAAVLPHLKADLAVRLTDAVGPDPWVDYYRSYERGQWFRTGYNGETLFTVEIRPPAWSRRARVDRWNIHR
jgi:hypothetical protein